MASFAVTVGDPSGLWRLPKETLSDAGASEWSKAIVVDMQASEGRSGVKGRLRSGNRQDIKRRAICAFRSAAVIVNQKAPSDAEAYKAWPTRIASNVAEASKKEGGYLGFGGVDVSEAEKAMETVAALGTRA